ncbi:hypothetical protein, partial [Sporolactobacillus vineae]
MKNGAEAPLSTIEALQKERDALKKQNAELTLRLKWFEEQLRLSQKRQFGALSEKIHQDPEQLITLQLFNEAESESNPQAPESTVETITYKREKTAGQRKKKWDNLPVEVINYRLPEEEQVCACWHCENKGTKTLIVAAPAPKPV